PCYGQPSSTTPSHTGCGARAVGCGSSGLGALDFAGGTVVHVSSGISALAAAMLIGRRYGFGHEPWPPHNLPFTVSGAALLWVGWFGFNAGSALSSGGLAANALVTTHVGAAGATLGWMFIEWYVTPRRGPSRSSSPLHFALSGLSSCSS